ncbi:YndJ family transporter [Flavilitoribacter nigricans]|uniref:YndJ-like protein n=1 Tax=Flavilitoribacter nigricans (strain ATCC 23147 / DSM 23189 / NBRC 102662 / NCIMB 1420 / SS-2) TaxID=1122177 RepID=A0A2D0N3V4_FLAN2|nr:YndJ family transporter [Flavilitoribacter nigricans]PHN03068.1 hypothetical protein CRP01_28725 [Flavilitoribacter nigricans DSM 23189 = NBRC 102662]
MDNLWVQGILLLAVGLIVPLALKTDRMGTGPTAAGKAYYPIAAGSLLLAHLLGPGPLSGLLATPWLLFSGYILLSVYRQWRSRQAPLSLFWLVRLLALVYLCIGAMWAVADRFSWQPLGFDPLIVLLTAVHFHYAGFALLWLAGKALQWEHPQWVNYLLSSVALGVPLTAVGITTSQWGWSPWIETAAVLIMAAGGIAVGLSYLRAAFFGKQAVICSICWSLAGVSLLLGMSLAILYGWRYYHPIPWLSIPWMYAVHGSLNSLGFALPALLGWYFQRSDQSVILP